MNNNGITPSHKRDKTDNNIKMPLIVNKSLIDETKKENIVALPPITTATTTVSSVKAYDCEGFQ
jgi:hypothetical protein